MLTGRTTTGGGTTAGGGTTTGTPAGAGSQATPTQQPLLPSTCNCNAHHDFGLGEQVHFRPNIQVSLQQLPVTSVDGWRDGLGGVVSTSVISYLRSSPGTPGAGTGTGAGVPGAASQPEMLARAVRCAPLVPPTLPCALFSGLRVAAAVNCRRGHKA